MTFTLNIDVPSVMLPVIIGANGIVDKNIKKYAVPRVL